MIDLPPSIAHQEIPRQCIVATLQRYQIPPNLFVGYLGQESGRVGMANTNKNGSVDYGPAQVNSAWLKTLKPYGITAQDLQFNPCTNIWVSGWIMRRCLNKFADDAWKAIGCYHTGENPKSNEHVARMYEYTKLVQGKAIQYGPAFQRWLVGSP